MPKRFYESLSHCGFNGYLTMMIDVTGRIQSCGETMDGGLDCAFCDKPLLNYDEIDFLKYVVGYKCRCGASIFLTDDAPFEKARGF